MLEPAAEQALIDSAVGGDVAAIEQLLLANYSLLEQHVRQKLPPRASRHFGADDILQLVFAQVFRDIAKFQPRGEGSFFAWLRTVADHRLIDELRKIGPGRKIQQLTIGRFANVNSFQELVDAVCEDSLTPGRVTDNKEIAQALQVAIAGLPDDQRQMILARYMEDKSVEQIAHEMGFTVGAVRGLIHRGKERLRETMGRTSSRWKKIR